MMIPIIVYNSDHTNLRNFYITAPSIRFLTDLDTGKICGETAQNLTPVSAISIPHKSFRVKMILPLKLYFFN